MLDDLSLRECERKGEAGASSVATCTSRGWVEAPSRAAGRRRVRRPHVLRGPRLRSAPVFREVARLVDSTEKLARILLMRWVLLTFVLGSSALACGSNESSSNGDSDDVGGTSGAGARGGGAGASNGGALMSAGSSTGGVGITAGSGPSGGTGGVTAGTGSGGTIGAGASGAAGTNGGGSGAGGAGGNEWHCAMASNSCGCNKVITDTFTQCRSFFPCCFSYVDAAVGESCYCGEYSETECEQEIASETNGLRTETCPP